jgi:hypothetical protein
MEHTEKRGTADQLTRGRLGFGRDIVGDETSKHERCFARVLWRKKLSLV